MVSATHILYLAEMLFLILHKMHPIYKGTVYAHFLHGFHRG